MPESLSPDWIEKLSEGLLQQQRLKQIMIDSLVQHTLNSEIEFSGVGLHTAASTMKVFQLRTNGYKFQRRDLDGEPIIDATTSNVSAH